MMAGDPNLWSINNGMHPQLVYGSSSPLSSSNPSPAYDHHLHPNCQQDFPIRSWGKLLLGTGLGNNDEEERIGVNLFQQQQKKLENCDQEQVVMLNLNPSSPFTTRLVNINNNNPIVDIHMKKELLVSQSSSCQFNYYGHLDHHDNQFNRWPSHQYHQVMQPVISSPTSCITNILNFSGENSKNEQHNQDHSYECNSTGTVGASKKARVTQSSAQPALKVRKEKLGDRITALHQLVSPFGKTDTASVLSEAIGYIRFLEDQIEALSSPYMRNASSDSQGRSGVKDLRSRGLCLVPISCTQYAENENGANYWAPTASDFPAEALACAVTSKAVILQNKKPDCF